MSKFNPKSYFTIPKRGDGIYQWPADQAIPDDLDPNYHRKLVFLENKLAVEGLVVCVGPQGAEVMGDRSMNVRLSASPGRPMTGTVSVAGKRLRVKTGELRIQLPDENRAVFEVLILI